MTTQTSSSRSISGNNDATFKAVDTGKILESFDKQIIKGILKEYGIHRDWRIGYVQRYIFDLEALANSFMEKTTGPALGGVNEINLRFSDGYPSKLRSSRKMCQTTTMRSLPS